MGVVVSLSGGLDSTTSLYWAKREFSVVEALTFDYGQRHAVEIESAERIAAMAGVPWHLVSVQGAFVGSLSALVDGSHERGLDDRWDSGLPKSFVPGRNIIFATIVAARAIELEHTGIVLGVNHDDYGGYPDCRPEFVDSLQTTLRLGLQSQLTVYTPLIELGKKAIIELAVSLPGCWEALALSISCYNGVTGGCGECSSCRYRAIGFEEAGMKDPASM